MSLRRRAVAPLVSCERSIRLIEFAKPREVVAIVTGDPAKDRGVGVAMATCMAAAEVALLQRSLACWCPSCRGVELAPSCSAIVFIFPSTLPTVTTGLCELYKTRSRESKHGTSVKVELCN